jgi:phospholipase C
MAQDSGGHGPGIEHVVVLMLENRSFDSVLGRLYPKSSAFDGLDGSEKIPWHRPDGQVERIGVWNDPAATPRAASPPDPDPGELFDDFSMQIFGFGGAGHGLPRMDGFVDNYMRQPPQDVAADPRAVMHYFTPRQLPVLSRLATAFGVSDRWHASAPCETWPNRYFAHCGTAGGHVNNDRPRFPRHWPRTMPTVFRRLGARGYRWKIYFHDLPQAATLVDLWPSIPTHFCLFEAEFARHARSGRLPHYSFIEPRYYVSGLPRKLPGDQHPPHQMLQGEQLIAAVYNALRAAPSWERTLLIITYDEHGGCFDHVPPPAAVPPGGPYPDGFRFNRYGVRVPAVIVSPYVRPGSIIRPPAASPWPFDHTSIAATLHKLFDLGPPLTPRVAAAPDLIAALMPRPENAGPAQITAEEWRPSRQELKAARRRKRNRHQRALRAVATGIPAAAALLAASLRGEFARRIRPRRPPATTPAASR